jgi:hypothetical protein
MVDRPISRKRTGSAAPTSSPPSQRAKPPQTNSFRLAGVSEEDKAFEQDTIVIDDENKLESLTRRIPICASTCSPARANCALLLTCI